VGALRLSLISQALKWPQQRDKRKAPTKIPRRPLSLRVVESLLFFKTYVGCINNYRGRERELLK